MSYIRIIDEVLNEFINDYIDGEYIPITESDIHGYIFSKCLEACEKYRLPKDVHINHKNKLLGTKKKIDVILGDLVAVEIKFEADYPGVSKPVVLKEEVLKDLERISFLREYGFEKAIFLFIDEDGEHYRNSVNRYKISQSEWKVLDRKNKNTYILCK
jgi:hypothetical protein